MITDITSKRKNLSYRILSCFIAVSFISNVVLPPAYAQVIPQTLLNLPAPGTMVTPTSGFTPALINGITIHPENPLEFDFIVSAGDAKLQGKAFEEESTRLIKYFLAALTVPEDQMWVNLSPYEKDRIVPEGFGATEMGRDLLAQDYILKQLTASLMYPEKELGKKFWDEIYRKAREQYGTTEIPVNTFNKVWIVPERAVVYEHGNSAFVVKSHLKIMLEEDYLAMNQGIGDRVQGIEEKLNPNPQPPNPQVSTEIIREVILPAIEKEVNEGQGFANLRQIYNSVILAAWFKQKLKVGAGRDLSLLGQVYVDKTKTRGVDVDDKTVNEKIYAQYLEAFQKGVYNYIKEDTDPVTSQMIPRKYFSGGTNLKVGDLVQTYKDKQPLTRDQQEIVGEYLAGLKDYNKGLVNVNLVELSEDMSVAEAQEIIRQAQERSSSSSLVASGEREQALKEDWKYYSEKFNGYLDRIRGNDEQAKHDLIGFLDSVGKIIDEEMADFPVEARYPLLKAAALLNKPDRQILLSVIQENRNKFQSNLADAISMMFDLVPAGWLEKRTPQMQGRVIYTVSPENLLLAGGLGYVMQVHEKFMRELGARVVSIEPMYKYRKDMHGELQTIDYEASFGIEDKREIGRDSVDIGGYMTGVRYWQGKLSNGKEVIFIEEIPREGESLRYTNTVYDYHNFGNRSWEEFSAFFSKAVFKLLRVEEERRKDEEKGDWKPAIVWGNDSQAAGAMALIVQEKNRMRDDDRSVFRDIYPVFTTHTYESRQNFGLDHIDRVLGQLLGLEKKYYSAGIRFDKIDMASLAIRLVDGAGGLANMVSRKHKVVLDRNQFDPDAKTVAITNGDDLSRAWDLVEGIYRDIYENELNDADDLTWQEARMIVEEAVRRLNISFVDEGVKNLGLDSQKPIVSYAGRLVNVKVSPFRTFTERNIKRLVADGFNVVLFGRLQNYKESMDLADNYRRIEGWIQTQKKADPAATAGWGSFVFKGQYNDAQKQMMLIASNLVALDSDDETGTSEWTEVNGAIALSWILASPWRLRAPDSRKVILGEGILAEANERGINLVIPDVQQDALLEEISAMRAKRYNRQAKDIIGEVEDAYYGAMKLKLSEAKSDPEAFYSGAIKSAKIAKIVNGYNTAAAYLTQWNKNLDVQSEWFEKARQVSKDFAAGLDAEQKQQLLSEGRNGVRNFVFHVPPIASISVHERLFESGGGLRSFRSIKGAVENDVWDGTLGQMRNGDYVKYIDGLTKGLKGQERVVIWLQDLMADDELSWYKKNSIFSEFVGTLIDGLENKKRSESTSSPMVKGEGVDLEGAAFGENVLIENKSGERVHLAEMGGEFFPRTPDGRPLIEDTRILIVKKEDAGAAGTSSPILQKGGFARSLVLTVGVLGILTCESGCGPGSAKPPTEINVEVPVSIKDVLSWMRSQQDSRTGLVESYDNTVDSNLLDQASTYDQALAVITNIQGGDINSARKIMDFFVQNWDSTHGFVNFYVTSSGLPGIQKALAKHQGSRVHSGPNEWIGIAASALYEATGDVRYLNLAIEIATWAAKVVPHDANGGIAMGPQDDTVPWTKIYPTEPNLDNAALLKKLLAKQDKLTTAEKDLFETELADAKRWIKARYNPRTGILDRGLNDATKALDATTLFVLTFGPQAIQDEFGIDPDQLIAKAEEYFGAAVTIPGIQGTVSGFDFTEANLGFRGPVVWFEGTGQMAAVYEVMAKWHETSVHDEMAANYRAKKNFYKAQIDKVKREYPDGRDAVPYASAGHVQSFVDGWYTPSNGPDGKLAVSAAGSTWRVLSDGTYNPMAVQEKPASSPMKAVVSDQLSVVSKASDAPGGIDLNPALLNLQIKRDGNGVPLPLPMQPIERMNIEGFIPVIINITPVTNLPLLLGIADDVLPADSADSDSQELGWMDVRGRLFDPQELLV